MKLFHRTTGLACLGILLMARSASSFVIGFPHLRAHALARHASPLHVAAELHDAMFDQHWARLFDADHLTRIFDLDFQPTCSPANRLHEQISHDADAGSTVLLAVSNECDHGFVPLTNVSVTVSKDELTLSADATSGQGRTVLRAYTLTHDAAANADSISAAMTSDGAIQLHVPNPPPSASAEPPRHIAVAPAPALEQSAPEPAPAQQSPSAYSVRPQNAEGSEAEARARAGLRAANPFDGIEFVEGSKGENDIVEQVDDASARAEAPYYSHAAHREVASPTTAQANVEAAEEPQGSIEQRARALEAELASLRKQMAAPALVSTTP